MELEYLKEDRGFFDIDEKLTCKELLGSQNVESASNISKDDLDDSEFDGINLDDDIEKVEVSSQDSSDFSEEDVPPEFSGFENNCEVVQNQPVANEELRNWLCKMKKMQEDIYKKMQIEQKTNINNHSGQSMTPIENSPNLPSQTRVMKYQDLPYMGEITLENSKPRRGRKPKKADICHLIYKNYGTILPGTPNASDYIIQTKKPLQDKESINKSNVQNRKVSSLLEKRLTQHDYKRQKSSRKSDSTSKNPAEPMNLCIRDHNKLKIKLTRNSQNTYLTDVKSEISPEDEMDLTNDSHEKLNNEFGVPQFLMNDLSLNTENSPISEVLPLASQLNLWSPDTGFSNPLSLQQQIIYYQKLAAMKNVPMCNFRLSPEIITRDSIPKETKQSAIKIKPKQSKNSVNSEGSADSRAKHNTSNNTERSSVKRKRSAIFIPPIPAENNTNPATEVSICKFKFTGGAKPSLQEKKMLSVDSGGNFRYYSGTGDKSMRGYEFFPRETLQQTASATQGSSTGAFLQASGEKIFPVDEMNEKQVKSEFLLSPELPSTSSNSHMDMELRHKKRKSRKSLQREKLEQTFREKGFLIQTQQLESAEGATYCKFRQLRKFTRYLFRSWKDYLPGNVQGVQENEQKENSLGDVLRISPETT